MRVWNKQGQLIDLFGAKSYYMLKARGHSFNLRQLNIALFSKGHNFYEKTPFYKGTHIYRAIGQLFKEDRIKKIS